VDIFALGCIMAELYNLAPLFPGSNEPDQLNKMVKILGTPDPNTWAEGHKLAKAKGYYFPDEKGQNLGNLIPDASP
jgi:protein kinase